MDIIHINYWAVIVSSIAVFALGSLWYTPILFGKVWLIDAMYQIICLGIEGMILGSWH